SSRMTMSGRGDALAARVGMVRPEFFKFTGLSPIAGRPFLPEESRLGGPHVVIISEQLWRSRYAGSPTALGQKGFLNDRPFTLVGVASASRRLPISFESTDAWIAMGADSLSGGPQAMLRLKPGVDREAAQREFDSIVEHNDAG